MDFLKVNNNFDFEFSGDIKACKLLNTDKAFIVQSLKKTLMFTLIDNPLTKC